MAGAYPIILAHGICRFDLLMNVTFGLDNQPDDHLHYFKGIRSTLQQAGHVVYHTNVAWADGVDQRADQLRDQLLTLTNNFTDHHKVHIIAHSMGGLDARHMICTHQMPDRVASLSTIGTPHLGTCFADWGVQQAGWAIRLSKSLGISTDGFLDLTTERCRRFNTQAETFERTNGVKYQTVTGARSRENTFMPFRLLPYDIIAKQEGPNDGLVSVHSATWSDQFFVQHLDADHLNEVGWCHATQPEFLGHREAFERGIREFYVELAGEL